jgi:hypothetical protein
LIDEKKKANSPTEEKIEGHDHAHDHDHDQAHDQAHDHAHDHDHKSTEEDTPFKPYDLPIQLDKDSSVKFLQKILAQSAKYPAFLSGNFLNLQSNSSGK